MHRSILDLSSFLFISFSVFVQISHHLNKTSINTKIFSLETFLLPKMIFCSDGSKKGEKQPAWLPFRTGALYQRRRVCTLEPDLGAWVCQDLVILGKPSRTAHSFDF